MYQYPICRSLQAVCGSGRAAGCKICSWHHCSDVHKDADGLICFPAATMQIDQVSLARLVRDTNVEWRAFDVPHFLGSWRTPIKQRQPATASPRATQSTRLIRKLGTTTLPRCTKLHLNVATKAFLKSTQDCLLTCRRDRNFLHLINYRNSSSPQQQLNIRL